MMSRIVCNRRARRGAPAAAVLGLAAALGACSSLQTPAKNFSSLFNSATPQVDNTALASTAPDFECPSITIRSGAATYSVSADPREPNAMNLRYQASVGDTARECRLANGIVTMKVGVQGRLVLGPAGGPGQAEVPLRIAVVQEGTQPTTIVTKLERIPVTIPENEPHVLFTHVDENISFPMPRGGLIDSYVDYVGFDPLAAREQRRPAPAKKRRTTS